MAKKHSCYINNSNVNAAKFCFYIYIYKYVLIVYESPPYEFCSWLQTENFCMHVLYSLHARPEH